MMQGESDTVTLEELMGVMTRLLFVMTQLVEVLVMQGVNIDGTLGAQLAGLSGEASRIGRRGFMGGVVMPHHRSFGSTTMRSTTGIHHGATTPSARP